MEENAIITRSINDVGTIIASDLDRDKVVQAVTDVATELTTAEFGAFFYNVYKDAAESYTLYTISGVPREAFSKFPMPRNTEVFEPTFKGTGIVRSADITKDPRCGRNPPHTECPVGNCRSKLSGSPGEGTIRETHRRSVLWSLGGRPLYGAPRTAGIGRRRLGISCARECQSVSSVREASQLKDDFLASLSHELRTPLNAILGYARMLRAGMVTADKHAKAIETIERNATSLAQIVEDVLDISRIVSGKLRLNVQPVDYPQIVRNAIDSIAVAADAKGVRIRPSGRSQAGPCVRRSRSFPASLLESADQRC